MPERESSITLLVAIAVIAGVLQIVAGFALGLAGAEDLATAAAEGAQPVILGVAGVMTALLLAWLLRERALWAVGVAVVGSAASAALMLPHLSVLGLIYHGEFVLHHFLALLAAAVVLLVTQGWAVDPECGRLRQLPVIAAGIGVVLLVGQHLSSLPWLEIALGSLWQVGTVALFAAVGLGLVVVWPRLGAASRAIAAAAAAPVAARLVLGGGAGLMGAPLGVQAAPVMTGTIAAASLCLFALVRPTIDRWARVFAVITAGTLAHSLYRLYEGYFAAHEDRVGGVARSIFGFDLPYPTYVPPWQAGAAAVAIFLVVSAILCGTIASPWRARGVALGLVVTAGLGLTSPQLELMHAAGLVALLAALGPSRAAVTPVIAGGPPQAIEVILGEVAERLELAAPVRLEQPAETVIALRGDHRRLALDLRARSADGNKWSVVLRIGVIGRGSPDAELIPDPAGEAPRLRGDAQRVGGEASGVLAALSAFPAAHVRFWAAGCEAALGDDLSRLSGASVEALCRALGRQIRGADS